MTRLGAQQRQVELLQIVVQPRRQGGKAFAGAGLDIGAADQLIDQHHRLMRAHFAPQAAGIVAGGDFDVGDIARQHHLPHLPEVMQFLFNQQNHVVQQLAAPRVVGLRHGAFVDLFMQSDKIRLRPPAVGEVFVRLQAGQQFVGVSFIRDVATHQQHGVLRRFQLAHHMVGQ